MRQIPVVQIDMKTDQVQSSIHIRKKLMSKLRKKQKHMRHNTNWRSRIEKASSLKGEWIANDHWKTLLYWNIVSFCFCMNANNNTYLCLRSVNATHNCLCSQFITCSRCSVLQASSNEFPLKTNRRTRAPATTHVYFHKVMPLSQPSQSGSDENDHEEDVDATFVETWDEVGE